MEGTKIITLTDDIFTEDSVIEVYPDSTSNVIPEGVAVSGHTCIISFDEDTPETIPVKIIVNNTDGLLDASEISYSTDYTVNQSEFNALTQSEFDRVDDLISEIQDDVSTLESDINTINDDLSSLDTRVTSSEANIGDLDELETSNKDNLVDALNEVFTDVSNGKELLADAITDKGVPTFATDTFETMSNNITAIPSGGGDIKQSFFDNSTNMTSNITVLNNGKGYVALSGWLDAYPQLKVNNVEITPTTTTRASTYGYSCYYSDVVVNKNDVITMSAYGSGQTHFVRTLIIV